MSRSEVVKKLGEIIISAKGKGAQCEDALDEWLVHGSIPFRDVDHLQLLSKPLVARLVFQLELQLDTV